MNNFSIHVFQFGRGDSKIVICPVAITFLVDDSSDIRAILLIPPDST